MICPCKDCELRVVGCHSDCSEYLAWKKERDSIIQMRIAENKKIPEFNRKTQRLIWKKMVGR